MKENDKFVSSRVSHFENTKPQLSGTVYFTLLFGAILVGIFLL